MNSRAIAFIFLIFLAAGCGEITSSEHEEHFCDHDETQVVRHALVDCTTREDRGYVRGEPFDISVVSVDGKPVELETANAYWVMQQAAAADGVQIRIVSGFRAYAEQEYLYNCYLNKNCNNGNLAARPGYSNHQSGHALDLNTSSSGVLNWLNNNGTRFGFKRTVPSENWHWEWWGGGPGGGICGVEYEGCDDVIPAEGGMVDDASQCFKPYGPSQYWRNEDVGIGGSLRWTNAFKTETPSNYARWYLNVAEAGRYRVEFSRVNEFFVYDSARYTIRANGEEHEVFVDQSVGGQWEVLGDFDFKQGEDQWIAVFDNSPIELPENQHIGADAMRLTPVSALPEDPNDPNAPGDPQNPQDPSNPDDPQDPSNPDDPSTGDPSTNDLPPSYMNPNYGDSDQTSTSAGCSTGGIGPAWWALLAVFGLRRRR